MAKIIANNGKNYDMDNLTNADRRELQFLGHLPKDEPKNALVADVQPQAVENTEGVSEPPVKNKKA